jgi:hypothetical protein
LTASSWGEEDTLKAYALSGSPDLKVPDTGTGNMFDCGTGFPVPYGVPDSHSWQSSTTPAQGTMPGGVLSVSAQGTLGGSGIVWATRPLSGQGLFEVPSGIVEAYDASNLKTKLWDSANAAKDTLGQYARYTPPTVANGKVYVATFAATGRLDSQNAPMSELVVYGPK